MMLRKLLDRYIFTELLSPFSLSLGTLCFIMLTRELLRLVELLVSKGVGIWAVLKVFAHLLPSFLVLTLPIAGIIASITAFGRLSLDKELDEPEQLAGQHDEAQDAQAEAERGQQFREDIPVQQLVQHYRDGPFRGIFAHYRGLVLPCPPDADCRFPGRGA